MIKFPPVLPIKYFPWVKRITEASRTASQLAHIRDEGMFQVQDPTYLTHRVLVLDSSFAALGEITGDDFDAQVINTERVITYAVDYSDYASAGDTIYIGIVDANTNKYMQNFMPNGTLASSEFWESSERLTIASNEMTWAAVGAVNEVIDYSLPIKVGAGYTMTVTVESKDASVTMTMRNGATTLGTCSVGLNTFSFTATEDSIKLAFSSSTDGEVVISLFTNIMDYEDVTPEWVSSPFCVKDVESSTSLIYGCAVNDYYGLYFASTGLIPKLRVKAELLDDDSVQEVETMYSSAGSIENYYASNIVGYRLRVDWLPSYLVHFMKVVFLLDQSRVDDVVFKQIEPTQVINDQNAEEIKAYSVMLTPVTNGLTFKRITTDPDTADCQVDSGAYTNAYFGEDYTQQGTQTPYYSQT